MTTVQPVDRPGAPTDPVAMARTRSWGAAFVDLGGCPSPLSADPDEAVAYFYFLACPALRDDHRSRGSGATEACTVTAPGVRRVPVATRVPAIRNKEHHDEEDEEEDR